MRRPKSLRFVYVRHLDIFNYNALFRDLRFSEEIDRVYLDSRSNPNMAAKDLGAAFAGAPKSRSSKPSYFLIAALGGGAMADT